MATPPKSKAVTIAPGVRYYGPKQLRPTTPYKRGGALKDLAGTKGFVDIPKEMKARKQIAQQVPPTPSAQVPFTPTQQPQSILPPIDKEGKPIPRAYEDIPYFSRLTPEEMALRKEEQIREYQSSHKPYETMGLAEKAVYWAETALIASAFGGQLSYAINFASNTLSRYLIGRGAGKVVSGVSKADTTGKWRSMFVEAPGKAYNRYRTAPGGVSPKEFLYSDTSVSLILRKSIMNKVLNELKKPATVKSLLFTAIGLTSLGEWGRGDALEGIDYTYQKAIETGDPILIQQTKDTMEEIDDPSMWEDILRLTPGGAVIPGLYQRWKSHKAKKAVNDFLADRVLSGDVKDLSDFNKERLDVEAEVIRMKEESRARIILMNKEANEGERRARSQHDDEARIQWLDYKKQVMALEKAEREAIAEFWLEYIKMKKKLLEDNSRSQLGFGLLGR